MPPASASSFAPPGLPASGRRARLTSPAAALGVLLAFWALQIASTWHKSVTSDEVVHAAAGYTFWRFNDYRLNPENGNLPQRLVALPLLWAGCEFPSRESEAWRTSSQWELGDAWFHDLGHDFTRMLRLGRAAAAWQAVALAALVWWWARELFGAAGGMLALLVTVLNPTLLAHGPLMTSDTACALFFLLATYTWWRMLHRVTWLRVLASALACAGLALAKMSGALVVVIALGLVVARLVRRAPLPVQLGRTTHQLHSRGAQAAVFAASSIVQLAIVIASIWAAHGFRYRAFTGADAAHAQHATPWEEIVPPPPHTPTHRALEFLRRTRGLPEAYVHGHAHALHGASGRAAFLNGEFSATGWRMFFPYTFLVKTPLPFFGLLALAGAAWWRARRTRAGDGVVADAPWWYVLLPLLVLWLVYWAAVIPSRLNIGHRHILATYPPLFILCGAAAWWWRDRFRPDARRWCGWLAGVFLALHVAVIAWRFPHYLAFFNSIAGGPARAYRHLVDSSLDWGQDLPGVARHLERHPDRAPFFLSYFGMGRPQAYGIAARALYSFPGRHRSETTLVRVLDIPRDDYPALAPQIPVDFPHHDAVGVADAGATIQVALFPKPAQLRLTAGTYLISASMLQPLYYDPLAGPWGPWNERFERSYHRLRDTVLPLLGDDPHARTAALERAEPDEWRRVLDLFEQYRFARLTAVLRQREPDDHIGYSILVYHVGADELDRALTGPPPELGPDLPRLSAPAAPPAPVPR